MNLGRLAMERVRASAVSGALYLYRRFIEPKSADEDSRRREFILNLILCGIILLLLWSECFIAYSFLVDKAADSYVRLEYFSLLCLYFLGLFIASRRGYARYAAYGLVLALLAATVYTTSRWGASLPAGILSYALIITMSAILISGRAGLVTTAIVMGVIAVLGRREIATGILPDWKHGLITGFDIIEYCLLFGVIAVVSWLSSREIEKSLQRAQRSEKALRAERDSLEIKVEERTAELREAQTDKMSQLYRFAEFGRLSSGLFHDLANPLSAVVMNIERISDSAHPEVRSVKEDLERAMKAGDRLANLITAVKKQLRPDSETARFSINRTIEEVLQLFAHASLSRGVTIEFKASNDIFILGSPGKLHQALTNLVSNALDSFNGSNETDKTVTLSVIGHNFGTDIRVSDNGTGIAPEILPKIFDPFFSTKSSSRGMGLGLSTVRTIIERDFGGAIAVESKPGLETAFTITLPLQHS